MIGLIAFFAYHLIFEFLFSTNNWKNVYWHKSGFINWR
jgi:hypothetical protein